ncbi:endolytic transglycosylase MltG [Rhizohabitans arisaemae]|uniref:endolytic transglycosylase MltG n=1 Tax=Rhizohabitans arisaemae TaxID=2720610 RepID=UPI0024B1EB7D|nr:endolytic transglycosylase MltG [Rhizohabitans arisaemae]
MSDNDFEFFDGEDDEYRTRRGSPRRSRGDGRGPAGGRGSGGRRSAGRRTRRRRRRGGSGRWIAPLLAVLVLAVVVGGGGYYGYQWVRGVFHVPDFTGPGSGDVVVTIKSGDTTTDIGNSLAKLGVVASAKAFTQAADAEGKDGSFQPGQYRVRKGMAAAGVVPLLDPDKRLQTTVTIKEGWRLKQILPELAKKTGIKLAEFEKAAKNGRALGLPSYAGGRLEGYAFPATYQIEPGKTATDVLSAMVQRYKHAADELDLESSAKQVRLTPAQIMILASIVQAEAGSVEDMGKISRVIYNRMAKNPPMKLEMDSTVMYALGKFGLAATHKETATQSPYNTYYVTGFPQGPIGNPGEDAIKAALNPTPGNWIYFVTVDPKTGTTKFTHDYAQHQQWVREFNRATGGG